MTELDLPDVHASALAATRLVTEGLGDSDWTIPTPCGDWDLRALANHLVAGNWWAAELAAGQTIADVGDRLDGDVLGSDALEAYDSSAKAAAAAFEVEGAMDAPCAVSYGPVPGSVYCGHRILDVVVHGWDLARATGQPTYIEPDLVDACLEILRPQYDMLLGSGMFGSPSTPREGATPQVELLAMLGRG